MRPQLAPALLLVQLCFSAACLHAQDAAPNDQDVPKQSSDSPAAAGVSDQDDAVPSHAPGESLARIVRLSQQRGVVQLDRSTGNGFEQAVPNMPVIQGVRLRTGEGLAEVEFEDNSSVRLTPDTEVDFPELKLRQNGAKVSHLDVKRGSVYVSMAQTRDNDFRVQFGDHTLTMSPSAHVHLFVGATETRLAVMNGEARIEGPEGVTIAGKKQTVSFDNAGAKSPLVAKGTIRDAYDEWDKNEVDYQKRYALASGFSGSPYGYGLADLNYYGSFINTGGCGQMWQPYFVGAGWSPYSAGIWAWYPGAGYSWVSMYPWGWTPFHSGEWIQCQGSGWGWRPSGGWSGITNLRRLKVTGNGGGTPIKPPAPPPPPRPRQPTLTLASTTPHGVASLPISGVRPTGEFAFQTNSAGLGVPRGAFTHLNKISASVQQRGVVTTTPNSRAVNTLYAGSVAPAGGTAGAAAGRGMPSAGNRSNAGLAPTSHAASAPAATHASSAPASAPAGSSHK